MATNPKNPKNPKNPEQPKKQIPPDVAEQVAAAGHDAIEQVKEKTRMRSMGHLSLDDFIMNDPEEEVVKGGQYESSGWLHSPAHLEMFAVADRRLTKVSEKRGKPVRQVEKVRASVRKGTKQVFIWPADADDLSGIPVNRWQSGAWINLVSLLSKRKLMVRTGFRERYAIEYAPDDCPLGPCLMIDLGKSIERRAESTPKKTEEAPATVPATAATTAVPAPATVPATAAETKTADNNA